VDPLPVLCVNGYGEVSNGHQRHNNQLYSILSEQDASNMDYTSLTDQTMLILTVHTHSDEKTIIIAKS